MVRLVKIASWASTFVVGFATDDCQQEGNAVSLLQTQSRKREKFSPVDFMAMNHQWSYDTMDTWTEQYPLCQGQAQSPINLVPQENGEWSGDRLALHGKYPQSGPFVGLSIFNNGHTVQMNGAFGELNLPDGAYLAKQFHFHFPSEHQIDGETFAGELQLVHQRVGSSGTDDLAIVSFMLQMEPGTKKSYAFFHGLGFNKKGRLPAVGETVELASDAIINIEQTFADQLNGPYFHYHGSLTTPPCTESVHWYISRVPFPISKGMVEKFQALFPELVNSRPVQELNNRGIVDSAIQVSEGEFYHSVIDENLRRDSPVMHEAPQPDDKEAPWDYSHPEQWGDSYHMCDGSAQSPVQLFTGPDEDGVVSTIAQAYTSNTIHHEEMVLRNNGHTLTLKAALGSLTLPNGVYDAKQLHMHFPSEHYVDGAPKSGEIQIVHQRRGASGYTGLAIVSILLEVARGNEASFAFWKELGVGSKDGLPAPGHTKALPVNTKLNIVESFADQFNGGYWHYKGSQTQPPCAETVHWYVMKRSAPVSKFVMKIFKGMFPSPANNRPVQALNGRTIVNSNLQADVAEFANGND